MSSYPYYLEERQEFPVLGVVSAWLGFGAVVITAVRRIIIPEFTTLWADPLLSLITMAVMALSLASLLYLRHSSTLNLKLAAIPLFINMSTLLIVYLVPFAEIWQDWQFQWRWHDYDEVVQLVEARQIQADATGQAQLPSKYAYLSVNGRVTIFHNAMTTLIIFTSQNSPHASGYLYTSNNQLPTVSSWPEGWRHLVQKRPNWFLWATPS